MRMLIACLAFLLAGSAAAVPRSDTILIFSGTTGYRHDSIPTGILTLKAIASRRGLAVVATEDPAIFAPDKLARFRAIVLLSTTTDPKNPASEWLIGERRGALQQFVARGGGILAIHAAADSHYHWPWYGQLIGARFARHPPGTPTGIVHVVAPRDPGVARLPRNQRRTDEWYYFDDYDPTSKLLITLDPASIGEPDTNPNPIAWTRQVNGGRVFYTAMGHTTESYSEPYFIQHVANGLDWVMKKGPGVAAGPLPAPRPKKPQKP